MWMLREASTASSSCSISSGRMSASILRGCRYLPRFSGRCARGRLDKRWCLTAVASLCECCRALIRRRPHAGLPLLMESRSSVSAEVCIESVVDSRRDPGRDDGLTATTSLDDAGLDKDRARSRMFACIDGPDTCRCMALASAPEVDRTCGCTPSRVGCRDSGRSASGSGGDSGGIGGLSVRTLENMESAVVVLTGRSNGPCGSSLVSTPVDKNSAKRSRNQRLKT
mmetsp:Transcript_7272/g.20626  ORF Transcript_7272/g.20626 Transcript_7272/m.20626 type:complete len:226 (-) Transcript_7272:66-743(-)